MSGAYLKADVLNVDKKLDALANLNKLFDSEKIYITQKRFESRVWRRRWEGI